MKIKVGRTKIAEWYKKKTKTKINFRCWFSTLSFCHFFSFSNNDDEKFMPVIVVCDILPREYENKSLCNE